MAFNNGRFRIGTSNAETIDLRWQNPFDVRDNAMGLEGSDTIYGNIADNSLLGGSGGDQILGGDGMDCITGDSGNDKLFGEGGDDSISGGADNDTLYGNGGFDRLEGGSGFDLLYADVGDDDLFGGAQDDTLHGSNGNDNLGGDDGNDLLYGEADADSLHGKIGADTLIGGTGVDILSGDDPGAVGFDDRLYGGEGGDSLYGEGGNDQLSGDGGNDFIFDGYGSHPTNDNDTMWGASGNDEILSVTGADYLSGGGDNDDVTILNAERLLTTAGMEAHGGTEHDVLHLEITDGSTQVLVGRPIEIDGFERLDIEDRADTDWTLTFRDVRGISDTDALQIDGDAGDRIRLENTIAGDALSGGAWIQGITQATADPNEAFTHFSYVQGGTTWASVSIDTDITVQLI
jgi:RTX calcium-binding nonapeptide repeat (4 copies)